MVKKLITMKYNVSRIWAWNGDQNMSDKDQISAHI